MSKVEILCQNGHRVSVNVSATTKIISILEEVCLKQGFVPINNYELKHGRKTLEMSASFDKSGLINNSKLELIKLKEGWTEGLVEVNVQTSEGKRIKNEFPCRTSIFEILETLDKVEKDVVLTKRPFLHPVIVYVNQQIVGEFEMQHTSLKSLGIIKGKTLFRHMFREIEEKTLREIEGRVNKERMRMERLMERSEEKKKENDERERKMREREESVVREEEDMETIVEGEDEGNQHLQQQHVLPKQESNNIETVNNNSQDNQTYTQPYTQPLMPIQPLLFTEFKFPESTKGKTLYMNDLSEYKKEEFQPCERETLIYMPEVTMQVDTQGEEVSATFYDVTEADAALMQKRLQGKVRELSDQSLSTEQMRLRGIEEAVERYARVIIRFKSASGHVIQALFMVRETVNALYKYVRGILQHENLDFELYTSPPRNILDDKTNTLLEANLVPMSNIYISTPPHTTCVWKEGVMRDCMTTMMVAEEVVYKWLTLKRVQSCQEKKDVDLKRKNEAAETKVNKDNGPVGVPKWFKKGKK